MLCKYTWVPCPIWSLAPWPTFTKQKNDTWQKSEVYKQIGKYCRHIMILHNDFNMCTQHEHKHMNTQHEFAA